MPPSTARASWETPPPEMAGTGPRTWKPDTPAPSLALQGFQLDLFGPTFHPAVVGRPAYRRARRATAASGGREEGSPRSISDPGLPTSGPVPSPVPRLAL